MLERERERGGEREKEIEKERGREGEREWERAYSVGMLYACKGVHNLFTSQREKEREREIERKRDRERWMSRIFIFKRNDGCLGTIQLSVYIYYPKQYIYTYIVLGNCSSDCIKPACLLLVLLKLAHAANITQHSDTQDGFIATLSINKSSA